MALIRICEGDNFFTDYDTDRGMYRVSAFEPDVDYIKDEYWFDAYEEKELGIIFPQTIGDITFYSKAELFEWVENMQKEFCSPPTGLVIGEVDKPIKIVFEGDPKIISGEDKYEMNMELLHKIGEYNFGAFDCSDMTEEEINRIVNEFNGIGCTSFQLTSEELKKVLEKSEANKNGQD